jgi:hypothetical protein
MARANITHVLSTVNSVLHYANRVDSGFHGGGPKTRQPRSASAEWTAVKKRADAVAGVSLRLRWNARPAKVVGERAITH